VAKTTAVLEEIEALLPTGSTKYIGVRFLYDHRKIDQFVEGRAEVLVEGGKKSAPSV